MKRRDNSNRFSGSVSRPVVVKSADLSDRTVIVLLVLVVIVSVISVVVYLQVLQAVSLPESNLLESNTNLFGADEPGSPRAQGTVTLQIIEPPTSDQKDALSTGQEN